MPKLKSDNKQWIPATMVKELTGCDNNRLIRLRKYNLIEYRGSHRGIVYDLDNVKKNIELFKPQTV